jgi:hypothetical protein
MYKLDTIQASALAALPEIGTDGDLPADIQVFPPGKAVKFTLQDYPGEHFEMDVDASVAAKANADLQNLIARAAAGEGSQPFADKNHEDAEKTFTPKRYFWGGDDPIKGGVRLVPDWSPFGAALVRAKAFSYFSQHFLFSKGKKKFLGLINENIGGLVNRPGFSTQAAFAKAAPSTTNQTKKSMLPEDKAEIGQIVADALKPISDKVNTLEANAKAAQTATPAKAGADNTIVTDAITAALKPVTDQLTALQTQHTDTLKAQAKAAVGKYIGRVGLAPADTKTIEFYEKSYLADPVTTEAVLGKLPARAGASRMIVNSAGGTETVTSAEPEDVFMAKAKAWGETNKIGDEAQALIAFARTPEGAELQDAFRNKVRTNSQHQ